MKYIYETRGYGNTPSECIRAVRLRDPGVSRQIYSRGGVEKDLSSPKRGEKRRSFHRKTSRLEETKELTFLLPKI